MRAKPKPGWIKFDDLPEDIKPLALAYNKYYDALCHTSNWEIINVRRLPEPIPARGALGLWEWTPPAGFDQGGS